MLCMRGCIIIVLIRIIILKFYRKYNKLTFLNQNILSNFLSKKFSVAIISHTCILHFEHFAFHLTPRLHRERTLGETPGKWSVWGVTMMIKRGKNKQNEGAKRPHAESICKANDGIGRQPRLTQPPSMNAGFVAFCIFRKNFCGYFLLIGNIPCFCAWTIDPFIPVLSWGSVSSCLGLPWQTETAVFHA